MRISPVHRWCDPAAVELPKSAAYSSPSESSSHHITVGTRPDQTRPGQLAQPHLNDSHGKRCPKQPSPVQSSPAPHPTRGCSERNLGTRTGPAKPALRSPSRRTLLASEGVATTPRLTHGRCCAAFLGFRCSRAGSRAFAHPSFRCCSHYRTRRRCPRLPPSPLDTHRHTVSSTAEKPHRHTVSSSAL
jgi:hypothetical protein